jgi:hypothetical protein
VRFNSGRRQAADLAPYAAIELVLPGGSLMALLLRLYRRHKKAAFFPTRWMQKRVLYLAFPGADLPYHLSD